MSFEPVDIFVLTELEDPVEGVLVKAYDPTGTTFFTQAVTDSNGQASFLLETLEYTLRFYKFQTGFVQPQVITVLSTPALNAFTIRAEPFVLPLATDPRLCRCSGFFRDISGAPKRWLDIHFIAKFNPLILESAAIVTEEQHIRTDKDGYAQIDLIRFAQYEVMMEPTGSDKLRCVGVPDLASTNLPDLLFPRVERIVFDPVPSANAISLAVAGTVTLIPTVYDSAGKPLTGTATSDVGWKSIDPNVASISVSATSIEIRGNAVGTTQLLASRLDSSIIKIPNTPIQGVPITITVV